VTSLAHGFRYVDPHALLHLTYNVPMPATASRRAAILLWVAAALLTLVAIQRLADGLVQLVWVPTPPVDLAIRWRETQRWFAGLPVYNDRFAVYPPGSYPLLWPALGG
jgi:hypothetical protein